MLFFLPLLAASAGMEGPSPLPGFDFSRSYGVWLSFYERRCTFFMTDVGMDARQLTDTLRKDYDANAGIEILTSPDTPARCIDEARRAIRRAGFGHYRVRPGADADRLPIP